MLRIGLLGCGRIGQVHARSVAAMADAISKRMVMSVPDIVSV